RGAIEVDIVRFHELVEVPTIAPLLAGCDRHFHGPAKDGKVFVERLRTDRVFDEERGEIFDQIAAANRFGEIEALVEIDAPIAVLADAFAHLHAFVVHRIQALARVVGRGPARFGRAHAKRAIARFDGALRALPQRHAIVDARYDAGGVVAFAVVAHH